MPTISATHLNRRIHAIEITSGKLFALFAQVFKSVTPNKNTSWTHCRWRCRQHPSAL